MLMRRARQCRWMRRSRGEEQDGAQGRRAAASGCIARMCCACCQCSRGVDFLSARRSQETFFTASVPPGHLLYKLIAGICGGEHGHQSFPLLGHSPASTFISCVIKLVMFTHSSLTDAAVVTFVVTHEAERHVLCVSHTSPALPLWLQRE